MVALPNDAVISAKAIYRRQLQRDALSAVVVIVCGLLGYVLFPSNLALLTHIIALALFVLSLDLVTGYCSIATIGHAALFGAGSYAAGIAAVSFGFTDPFSMVLAGALGGAVMGLVSGAIILRGKGLSQLVLSIALVQLCSEAANKASAWTGGSDGLSGIAPDNLFGLFTFDLFGRTAYGFALALLAIVFVLLRVLVRAPFGMLCRGIMQDPVRIRAMGAPVYSALLRMYVVAGLVAGIGGAINAISTQVVGLDSISFTLSAEALVMLVLGGTGNLFGALIGVVIFTSFEHVVSLANPFHWLTAIGLMLILVVLFAPRGLSGALADLYRRWQVRQRS